MTTAPARQEWHFGVAPAGARWSWAVRRPGTPAVTRCGFSDSREEAWAAAFRGWADLREGALGHGVAAYLEALRRSLRR